MAMGSKFKRSILIINPNTTKHMTDGLRPLVNSLGLNDTHFEYFTAPYGVPSINDEDDAAISADACLPALKSLLCEFDGFLVCCYSHHPLVSKLRAELDSTRERKAVTGIFEASVAICLQSINLTTARFGIVSTGKQWEEILSKAVADLLGSSNSSRYAGTETTGLNANELHTMPQDEVNAKMIAATKRLLANGATAICLGCAGMAGMDAIVGQACVEYHGEVEGNKIKIVDGVVSGVIFLDGALRAGL